MPYTCSNTLNCSILYNNKYNFYKFAIEKTTSNCTVSSSASTNYIKSTITANGYSQCGCDVCLSSLTNVCHFINSKLLLVINCFDYG